MSRSASRIWPSSSSRICCRMLFTRKRSAGGQGGSPFCVLSTAIITMLLLVFVVWHAEMASKEEDPTLNNDLFNNIARNRRRRLRNMTALTEHTTTITSNRRNNSRRRSETGNRTRETTSGGDLAEDCYRNPMWDRLVDVASYEYGCKEIKQMLASNKELIGNGKVRDVYFVEYRGRKVVVKTLRHVNGRKSKKNRLGMHKREVVTLDALNGHPNIVNMLGLCGTTIVTEYFDDNFKNVIRRNGKSVPVRRVVSLALDVARGIQALHEIVGGVHMDMKPQQLLVDGNGRGKVNDFNSIHLMGLRPDVQGEFCPTHAGRPTRMIPWRSPENVAGEPVSEKADIYSLGMIFYSLINGAMPYPTEESFQLALIHKTRPAMNPSWHTELVQIIENMWSEDPEDRPSAREVVAELEGVSIAL